MSLIPTQIDDAESAESEGDYTLTDGNNNAIESDGKLESIKEIINGSEKDSVFTIIVNNNDTNFSGFTLSEGKEVTLTSSSDEAFTLTKTSAGRHFTVVSGTLELKNIILDGNKTSGGIKVEKDGTLVMNDGAVIQKCSVPGTNAYGGGVYNSGAFTMNNGVISGNAVGWNSSGGGVYNEGTFTMNNGVISGNTASGGGGVYNKKGCAFTMMGGEISNNNDGGVSNSGTFTMGGGEISNNNGDGVSNMTYGTFTMNRGEISGNSDIGVSNASTFTMGGGEISNNNDGGVFNYGMFTMNRGEISGNTATDGGGGVLNNGTFTMIDGEISGNKAGSGEGGGVSNIYGKFTMEGGAIFDNTAKLGGAVYIEKGTFTMSGGKISGNTANNGGAVYIYKGDTFTMKGGEISGNTASLGGGVFVHGMSNFIMNYGKISGNTATGTDKEKGSGGGIYTEDYTKLKVGDGAIFSGNTAPTLRTKNIENDAHTTMYENNISGKAVLSAPVSPNLNAPAYNNFDINYPGDAYVVFIEVTLSGSGTIKVTDSADSTKMLQFNDGYVHVPVGVSSITLSAEPETGYEFARFAIGGSQINGDTTNVGVKGNMEIEAELVFTLVPPVYYTITPTEDGGSEINPNEEVKVLQGEDKEFTFFAKSGYRITAVFVDDVEISPEELASGKYTFFNVESDHEIRVESEVYVEIGGGETGTGPGNGNGTGSGNGNGTNTGPGSDGGKGDIEDGNGNGSENIGSGPNLSESLSGEWSVLGLICAVLAILTGMIAVAAGKGRFRTDNNEKRSKTGMTLRALALFVGIVSVAAFFLTEDRSLSAAAFGEWTFLMFVMFLAALILAMVSFRFDETDG